MLAPDRFDTDDEDDDDVNVNVNGHGHGHCNDDGNEEEADGDRRSFYDIDEEAQRMWMSSSPPVQSSIDEDVSQKWMSSPPVQSSGGGGGGGRKKSPLPLGRRVDLSSFSTANPTTTTTTTTNAAAAAAAAVPATTTSSTEATSNVVGEERERGIIVDSGGNSGGKSGNNNSNSSNNSNSNSNNNNDEGNISSSSSNSNSNEGENNGDEEAKERNVLFDPIFDSKDNSDPYPDSDDDSMAAVNGADDDDDDDHKVDSERSSFRDETVVFESNKTTSWHDRTMERWNRIQSGISDSIQESVRDLGNSFGPASASSASVSPSPTTDRDDVHTELRSDTNLHDVDGGDRHRRHPMKRPSLIRDVSIKSARSFANSILDRSDRLRTATAAASSSRSSCWSSTSSSTSSSWAASFRLPKKAPSKKPKRSGYSFRRTMKNKVRSFRYHDVGGGGNLNRHVEDDYFDDDDDSDDAGSDVTGDVERYLEAVRTELSASYLDTGRFRLKRKAWTRLWLRRVGVLLLVAGMIGIFACVGITDKKNKSGSLKPPPQPSPTRSPSLGPTEAPTEYYPDDTPGPTAEDPATGSPTPAPTAAATATPTTPGPTAAPTGSPVVVAASTTTPGPGPTAGTASPGAASTTGPGPTAVTASTSPGPRPIAAEATPDDAGGASTGVVSAAEEAATAERFAEISERLSAAGVSAPEELADPGSPRFRAATWLAASADPSLFRVSDDYENNDVDVDAALVERYVLAVLWFALGGDVSEEGGGFSRRRRRDLLGCSWRGSDGDDDAASGLPIDRGVACDDASSSGRVRRISLPESDLRGSLPSEIRHLSDLEHLDLRGNYLSGSIPGGVGELIKLTHLDLSRNGLTGEASPLLREWPGRKLPDLEVLNLSDNDLNLSYDDDDDDDEDCTESRLLVLGLSGNRADNGGARTIPDGIGRFASLKQLYLRGSDLTGTIPAWIFRGLPDLELLNVSENDLTGNLVGALASGGHHHHDDQQSGQAAASPPPSSLLIASNLKAVLLHHNRLTGTLPVAIAQATDLAIVSIHGNDGATVGADAASVLCGIEGGGLRSSTTTTIATAAATAAAVVSTDCQDETCPCCVRICCDGGVGGHHHHCAGTDGEGDPVLSVTVSHPSPSSSGGGGGGDNNNGHGGEHTTDLVAVAVNGHPLPVSGGGN